MTGSWIFIGTDGIHFSLKCGPLMNFACIVVLFPTDVTVSNEDNFFPPWILWYKCERLYLHMLVCWFCFVSPTRNHDPMKRHWLVHHLTWRFLFLMTLSQGCAIHFQVFPSHLCLHNWTVLMNCHFISVKFILTWTFGLLLLLFTGEGDDRGGRWSGRGDGQRIHGWILWAGGFLSFFFTLSFVLYTVLFYLSIHVFHWCNASWIWASSAITAKFQNDMFSIGEYCDVTWILQPNLKLWPSGNLC